MATALIGGLINGGYAVGDLSVAEPLTTRRQELSSRFGVQVFADNNACAARGDVVVLAVKPQFLRGAVAGIATTLQHKKPLLISVSAGIRSGDIARWSGAPLAVVRAMPNTPALLGVGAAGLFANAAVDAAGREVAARILGAVGEVFWVDDEALIDAVTAVSGSAPAYYFLLMELLSASAVRHGLDAKTADALAVQTAFGAATLAKRGDETPAILRQQVTSPGGTTQAALAAMHEDGLPQAVARGVDAAVHRSRQLADDFADADDDNLGDNTRAD